MAKRTRTLAALALLIGTVALSAMVALRGALWIDAKTPGFFIDPSGQISLLSLPGWPDGFAHWPSTLERANGVEVLDPAHLYQLVRDSADGEVIAYETSRLGSAGPDFTAAARTLSRAEFVWLFLGTLLNGLLAVAVATLVWRAQPRSSAAAALLVAGLTTGILAITSVAVVADGSLARVNILAQSFAGAGLLHLALAFPTTLTAATTTAAMFAVYTPFAALALVYQLTWPDPYGSGLLHGITTAAAVVAAGLLVLGMVVRLRSRYSIVTRRRAAIGLCGVGGVAAAAIAWAALTQWDWRVLSAAAVTAGALVPLAIGSAIAARDFFALDERLRAIVTYALAIPTAIALYATAAHFAAEQIIGASPSPAALLAFALANLTLLLALVPAVRLLRGSVDRLFSPRAYSAERSLSHLNHSLSSARTTQTLVSNTLEILRRTLAPTKATLLLRARGAGFSLFEFDDAEQRKIAVPEELAERLEADEDAIRYQWNEGAGGTLQRFLDRLDADLLMPVYRSASCVGVLALSAKQSARPYDARDIAFLRTAARQIALALPNAAAHDKLDVLHKHLDALSESLRLQTNRTETLKAMNAELAEALNKLRQTHLQFGESHQEFMQAERLATANRISTGLTQQISGPLGAVLNALHGIAQIGRELADEEERRPNEQGEAIAAMLGHAQHAAAWLERTIATLRSFHALGHGAVAVSSERFALRDAFADVTQLLRRRLRESNCKVEYSENPPALQLYGSRQRFALILVDLVSAALQAYETSGMAKGHISVEAEIDSAGLCLRVVDWAGGLPAAAIPHLLDRLGNDAVAGNRRGMWMARNLIEEGFGGTLEASVNDERACFTAVFPTLSEQRGAMVPPPPLRRAG